MIGGGERCNGALAWRRKSERRVRLTLCVVILGLFTALSTACPSFASTAPAALTPTQVKLKTYLALVEKRVKRHSLGDLSRYAAGAMYFAGEERLFRLYLATQEYDELCLVEDEGALKRRLVALAKAEHNQRITQLVFLDDLFIDLGDQPAKLLVEAERVDANSADPIVKAHAKHLVALTYSNMDQGHDALKVLSEARAIIPGNDRFAHLMWNENWTISSLAFDYYNDIDDALDALIVAESEYPASYPNISFSSLSLINRVAIDLGDEKASRMTANTYRKLAPIVPNSDLYWYWPLQCSRVEDAFGTPNSVLDCLKGVKISDKSGAQLQVQLSVLKGVALSRLGRTAEAKQVFDAVDRAKLNSWSPRMARSLMRLEAWVTGLQSDPTRGLAQLDNYWRVKSQVQAQEYRASNSQLTRELRDHVETLKRADAQKKRIIELESVLTAAALIGIAAILVALVGLRRLNRQLVAARAAAETANAVKDEFLANISHEIRTPMNGMMGMIQALELGDLNAEQKSQLQVMRRSSQGVLGLLNDLLDLSKIEAGKLTLEDVPFDAAQAAEELVAVFAPAAEEKGVEVRLTVDPEAKGWFLGDVLRWRQVLANLLSNAVKFTEQGAVTVSMTMDGDALTYAVTDSGLGMTPEQLSRLFQKFEQADASTTRKFGGTGLGLAITRQLILAMGGGVTVESVYGEGSTFRVSIPMPRVEGAAEDEDRAADLLAEDDEDFAPLRILVAEDHPVNQLVISTLIGRLGGDLTVVGDGEEAVQAFAMGPWDLVMLDIQMPRLDGYEAVAEIRKYEIAQGLSRTPIVALTANMMTHQVAGYHDAGFDDQIGKPIELRALAELMDRVRVGHYGGDLSDDLTPDLAARG